MAVAANTVTFPLVRKLRTSRLLVVLGFSLLSIFFTTGRLYAGTVTIVDGPNAFIDNQTFNDAYIEAQLAGGNFIIDTADATGGPNDIHIAPQAVITWTSGTTLQLVAGERIVVSGTIQHDGPGDGSGGVTLSAGGDVLLGLGTQPISVTVGSRHGLTRVDSGANVRLQGGDASGVARSVLLGFRAADQGATYTVTGPISVTATLSVTGAGGDQEYNYVQIGHGGTISVSNSVTDGIFIGPVAIVAGVDISFTGGIGSSTYAQVGNGGISVWATLGGSHSLDAGRDISFRCSSGISAYALMGNGGTASTSNSDLSGDHTLAADRDIIFSGGSSSSAYAQAGNGGIATVASSGNITGSHSLDAGREIVFSGSSGPSAYAQVGNGGIAAVASTGTISGSHTLTSGGNISFTAGIGPSAYAQAGNGGIAPVAGGGIGGNHALDAGGNISFTAGSGPSAYVQAGNGGIAPFASTGHINGSHTFNAGGNINFIASSGPSAYVQAGNGGIAANAATGGIGGSHIFNAGGNISLIGGSGPITFVQTGNGGIAAVGNSSGSHLLDAGGNIVMTGSNGSAQVGNGGLASSGNHSGDLSLIADGLINATAGNVASGYVLVGHGIATGGTTGTRSGDIIVRVGEDLILNGAHIGHNTLTGLNAITDANTFIAVSQNNPYSNGSGEIIATDTVTFTVAFTSALSANGGQLRFYVPEGDNVTIPNGAPMNNELFPGFVPDPRAVGFFLFADGPYVPEYSFYFGGQPNVGIVKELVHEGATLLPGQPLTYTLTFSNSGNITATNVTIADTLPALLTNVTFADALDSGVVITPSGSAPNLAWTVSDLGVGQGGQIFISANVDASLNGDTALAANTVVISATADITLTTNSASSASASIIVPRVQVSSATQEVDENGGAAVVTVTLDIANPYAAVIVNYDTIDDSAIAASDYTAADTTLTINPGLTSGVFAVAILDDATPEADETFDVALSGPTGAALGAATSTQVVIHDNDSAVVIAPLVADAPEGNSGGTPFTFTITRTGNLTESATVDYSVSGDVDGDDFVGGLPSGTITFAAGEASQVVASAVGEVNQLLTLTVQGDMVAEADESFVVTLSNPSSNVTIVTASVNGIIRNDEGPTNLDPDQQPADSTLLFLPSIGQ